VASKPHVRLNFVIGWLSTMFEIVEYVDLAADCFRCDYLVRLWHASGSVNFALVVDLYFYLNPITAFLMGLA